MYSKLGISKALYFETAEIIKHLKIARKDFYQARLNEIKELIESNFSDFEVREKLKIIVNKEIYDILSHSKEWSFQKR